MENNDFDGLIRNKLKNLNVEYNAEDWNKMKAELDLDAELSEGGIDDIVFDGIVYENISRLEVPYNSDHWTLMDHKLRPAKALMARLRRYKIAEMALVALAIFTFLQLFPPKPKTTGTPAITELTAETETTAPNNTINSQTNENPANILSDNSTAEQLEISNSKTTISSAPKRKTNKTNTIVESSPTQDATVNGTAFENTINHSESKTTAIANDLVNSAEENKTAAITETVVADPEKPVVVKESFAAFLPGTEIPPSLLDYDYGDPSVDPCVICKKRRLLQGMRIGMFASSDANYIMTPYDAEFTESAYEQFTFGYGGGVTIGFKFKRWELETGAIYAYKYYAPKLNVKIDKGSFEEGYTGVGLRAAELNILEIPINLHYNFKRFNKWHLYGLGGSSFNYAYKANYDLQEYLIDRRGGSPNSRNGGSIFSDEQVVYKRYYFSANLGLGVERFFNTRWSMFLQPYYKHQMLSKGIGPNDDRINTFSIFGGVKASL